MSGADLQWMVGISVTTLFAMATIVLGAFYRLGSRQSANVKDLHDRIDRTNERIVQVKDNYVRRDDFHEHMKRIEEGISKLDGKLDKALESRNT